MPRISFSDIHDRARIWVFAADTHVSGPAPLLDAVDAHLASWAAHGVPLLCARDWIDDRLLLIAVDEAATGASGCSIDGLFRTISRVQSQVGADLLASGRVVWRDDGGALHVSSQTEIGALAVAGKITPDTAVLSTLCETVGEWRTRPELPARESWAANFLPRTPTA